MESRKYSALMSVYYKERPEYLRASIQSMLDQTIPPADFVVVCDGPLPGELWEVLEEFQEKRPDLFQLIRLEENQGLGVALNIGIGHCKHSTVARMDSDDVSMPDRCERQLRYVAEGGYSLVGGTLYEFEGDFSHIIAVRKCPETQQEILRQVRRRNPFNHPLIMYRKEDVLRAGGYRHMPLFEDYDLWARMLKVGCQGYNIQEPLLYMRAGEAMYARRGGLSYARKALRFRWELRDMGMSTLGEFLVAGVGQAVVCILPNRLRQYFYRKILRS
ncbi:MAG: glycosyltransferase [Blautia sp.]